ncbi:MAG: nucleoside deaminase [Bryobacterales bacterium]|nr:nucleoside deaminase [Bryobacterales bacterium]
MPDPFMQMAIELAVRNAREGAGGPFAAVVVKGGRVIAAGTNRVTSTNDPTAHAEVIAIREACRSLGTFQLAGCEIYASCEPCPMCLGAIYWARLDRICYAASAADAARAGFDDAFIYRELAVPAGQRSIPTTQTMREEGLAAFAEWASRPDKVPY